MRPTRSSSLEPERRVHRLTIDLPLCRRARGAGARARAARSAPDISVAILAVDNASGEVRARVASAGLFRRAPRRPGRHDAGLRSPGSTLKPFIYGLGFEDGLIHPETLIDDRPARYGSYAPENFDLTFQGTVTVRRALQLSLNVPAIAVLEQGRRQPPERAARPGRRRAGAAEERGAGPRAWGSAASASRLTDLVMLYAAWRGRARAVPLSERADGRRR